MTLSDVATYAAVILVVSLYGAYRLQKWLRRFARKHRGAIGFVIGLFAGRTIAAKSQPPPPSPPQPKLDRPTTLYRYYDAQHRLLYVGITCRGPKRAAEHAKSQPWWPRQVWMRSEHYDTWAEAEEAERVAIAAEEPECNQQRWDPRGRKAS